ncbi:MAG TPA: AmmeMemoRadiSam system protein A [Phycisphaerae bacterium]|nr:AmmeMemoRadiSam system protein A [Phycisphaerae bacterium]
MPISADDRAQLAALARKAVEAEVNNQPLPRVANPEGILAESRGCFVTLTNAGRLRGCIGTFQPRGPLAEMIVEIAAEAAHDGRFIANPVTPKELPELKIEVSVLSPLREIKEPAKLSLGEHGIYIVHGPRSGCFLPEVATETGWSAEEFLDQCCVTKAGLHAGAWRQPETSVYVFTSEKFDQ